MSAETLAFLKTVDIFATASPEALAAVAGICRERAFADDERIFREGGPADGVLVLVSGEVRCDRGGAEITRIAPGEAFGVTSFLDDGPRTVEARAVGRVKVLVLDREPFLALARERPSLLQGLAAVTRKHLRSILDVAAAHRGSMA